MGCNWIIRIKNSDGEFFIQNYHGELTSNLDDAWAWYHKKYARSAASCIKRCLEPGTTWEVKRRREFKRENETNSSVE